MTGDGRRVVMVVESITPKMAEAWLEKNYQHQRHIRWSHVDKLADQMRHSRWKLTHQGIAFSDTGRLIDGQHRLWAIIKADVAITMTVTRGVPDSSFVALDQGHLRSVSDVAGDPGITAQLVAVARAMARGPTQGTRTLFDDRDRQLMLAFVHEHRETLDYAIAFKGGGHVRGTRVLGAQVLGVIARARPYVTEQMLQEFVDILISGMIATEGDVAALLLRDYLIAPQVAKEGLRSQQYQKTQRALKAFVERDPIKMLYALPDDFYPMPGKAPSRVVPVTRNQRYQKGKALRIRRGELPKPIARRAVGE